MKRLIMALISLCLLFIGVVILFFNLFPIKYTVDIKRCANEYNVPSYIVASVINVESRFEADARSHADAMGLMQLKLGTAKDMAKNTNILVDEINVFDTDINIKLGTKYIAYLLEMFDGNEVNALASYNWGLQNVKDWIGAGNMDQDGTIINIPVRETEMYIRKYMVCKFVYRDVYRLR